MACTSAASAKRSRHTRNASKYELVSELKSQTSSQHKEVAGPQRAPERKKPKLSVAQGTAKETKPEPKAVAPSSTVPQVQLRFQRSHLKKMRSETKL